MNSLRIGCDRIIRWSITSGGEPYDLSGKNIRLKVSTRSTQFYVSTDDFYIDGNKIIWLFRGKDQKHLGPYTLTYIENEGMDDMLTFDRCNAFNFVACSCQESRSSSKDMEISNIDLSSEITALGVKLLPNLIPLTYQDLLDLRESSSLVPGRFYRITDYVTTTSQENTQSAGHQFDVIVLALSEDALSERAYAMLHEVESHRELTLSSQSGTVASYRETGETVEVQGQTYYRWDRIGGGDSVYFNTATPTMGSTPYFLQSDGNMAWDGYFFLNIDPETVYDSDVYFHEAGVNLSAWQIWYCLDNDTERFAWAVPASDGGKGVIYRMIDEWNNDCPYDFKNIQFRHPANTEAYPGFYYTFTDMLDSVKDKTVNSTFKSRGNSIGFAVENGILILNNNIILDEGGYVSSNNKFYPGCKNNVLGWNCDNNTFSFGCENNILGKNCTNNTFGKDCDDNTLGDNCTANSLGEGCSQIEFYRDCNYNSIGNYCTEISFKARGVANKLGNRCSMISLGTYCYYNSFGNYCRNISLGNEWRSSSFGSDCNNIGGTFHYSNHNIFDNGVNIPNILSNQTASSNQQVQNYHFTAGLAASVINVERNRAYQTTVAIDSAGSVKQFCIADIIQ